jgi:excisionase family DNA binding protein
VSLARAILDELAADPDALARLRELTERPDPAPEPWVDVAGAAEHLACKRQRIYDLVHAKRIPHHRDGSRLLFRRSELDVWLADKRNQ